MFFNSASLNKSLLYFLAAFGMLAAAACQKNKPAAPAPRYAVLRFENLTGDSSLEWTSRAASEMLAVALQSGMDGPVLRTAAVSRSAAVLGGHSGSAPGVSSERPAALLAGANRIITGYVERVNGRFRVTASEENVATGKNARTVSAADDSFNAAVSKVAVQFTPKPQPYLTMKPDAIRYYAAAMEEPVESGTGDFQKAIDADPDFGPAWVSRATLDAARGDRAAFTRTVDEARQRRLDPFSLAQIDLESATVAGDAQARIAALRKIADLSPGDNALLRTLAETETASGEFKAAAADWSRLTAVAPLDADAWNNLGYARSYMGDFSGGLAALKEYARLRPNDANPLDSTGDVYYESGRFAEAAAAYAEATKKDANFERGGDLYKAAWAKFRAGDRPGGDKLMDEFRAAREKQGDPLAPLFAADWLYRTGRAPQAVALLRQTAAEPKTASDRASALAQIAVWDLLADDRAKAGSDLAAIGRPNSLGIVAAAVFSAMPSTSPDEWQARAQRLFPDPRMQALRRSALAYALLLDGKREAALPVWKEIAAASPTDFFAAAIVARLEGRKPEIEPVPTPGAINEFRAVLDKLTP